MSTLEERLAVLEAAYNASLSAGDLPTESTFSSDVRLLSFNTTTNGLSTISPTLLPSNSNGNVITETDDDTIIHIILTGQSNADGRGLNSQASSLETQVQSSCEIWNSTLNVYQDLNIGSGNNNCTASGKHGIELGLAKYFQDYFPNRKLRLIKRAQGGTHIIEHLSGGSVYTPTWNDHVEPAISQTISEGKNAEVYMVFIQGEADSDPQSDIDVYEGKLNQWINLWTTNLSSKLWIRQIQIIESDSLDPQINEIYKNVAFGSNNYDYLVTKNESSDDDLHYNYSGLKQVAIAVLKEMKARRSRCIIRESLSTTVTPPPPTANMKLRLSHTSLDYILLSNEQGFAGNFDVTFFVNIASEAGSNYVCLFAGGTEATGDPCRFLVSPSQDKAYLQIDTETAYLNSVSLDFNTDYIIRLYRTGGNVYMTVNNGNALSFGVFNNTLKIKRIGNSDIWLSGNSKKFDGEIGYFTIGANTFDFSEGSGANLTGGSLTADIQTTNDLNYINNTIWL